MGNDEKICFVCEKPLDKCECCAECGHVCSLDFGELYCPVCFPEKQSDVIAPSAGKNDEYFMRLALQEAEKAFAKSEVPVGAVLVVDNRIIAAARNSKVSSSDPTAHAELLAIRDGAADMADWRLNDATLYVTKEPCVMCAGAMINARLGRLVYGCRDERFGAVNSRHHLLHDPGLNHQVRVVQGVMEDECAELLKKFFKMRR